MKKLKLKALELGATELLTREQLKNVIGGSGSGSGAGGSGMSVCGVGPACRMISCTVKCPNGGTAQGECGPLGHNKCACGSGGCQ